MVSAGDCVVGRLHTGRHAVLTGDTVRLIRPVHATTVAATPQQPKRVLNARCPRQKRAFRPGQAFPAWAQPGAGFGAVGMRP